MAGQVKVRCDSCNEEFWMRLIRTGPHYNADKPYTTFGLSNQDMQSCPTCGARL